MILVRLLKFLETKPCKINGALFFVAGCKSLMIEALSATLRQAQDKITNDAIHIAAGLIKKSLQLLVQLKIILHYI